MNKIFFLLIFIFINIHNSYSKGYIKANQGIEWDSDNQTYIATGNVIFKNESIEAASDKMVANYIEKDGAEIFTVVEFFKNIVIYFKDEIFKGDYAIYTKDNNIIKINGNVSIESPTRLLTGDELIVDLDNNTRTLNSNTQESIVEVLIENNANN
jgi:lipopolysaccharide export system protein LptA